MLVKLQRPPPEMRIFFPGRSARSSTATRRPRLPASIAHSSPTAPAPRIRASHFWGMEVIGQRKYTVPARIVSPRYRTRANATARQPSFTLALSTRRRPTEQAGFTETGLALPSFLIRSQKADDQCAFVNQTYPRVMVPVAQE